MVSAADSLAIVDQLSVEVISDNVSDTYVSKTLFAVSEFTNVVLGGAKVISGETLLAANLGYGLRLRSRRGDTEHVLLFDTGTEGAIFIRNCRNLALDLGEIEEIAITHGHWDHMGALPDAIDAIVDKRGGVTVHVNPGMFNERGVLLKSGTVIPVAKVPTPAEMAARGATVINDPAERLLLDRHFYYGGEIPRVSSFETGRIDHLCRRNNEEDWVPDPYLMDERMLVVHVRDLGLIVFSACSHAGIVNVCTEVQRLFPDLPIHAVMGGLHLGGVMERIIPETVEALKPFDIRHIITGHCTGWRALHALAAEFGERVSQSAVGTSYVFDGSAPPAAQ
jgi:7,8-dihydropterin-6-yl-methyl-4-(beta-D-ribofuranosyl)aminobenzene 5'-phosphate synthase